MLKNNYLDLISIFLIRHNNLTFTFIMTNTNLDSKIVYEIYYTWNVNNNNYHNTQLYKHSIEKLRYKNNWTQHQAIFELICQEIGWDEDYCQYMNNFTYSIKSAFIDDIDIF
jgi:hypothetical protein